MELNCHSMIYLRLKLSIILTVLILKGQTNDFCSDGGYCKENSCSLDCGGSGGRQVPAFCLFEIFEEESIGYEVFTASLRPGCGKAKVVLSTEANKYFRLDQSQDRILIKHQIDVDVLLENGQRLELLFGAIGCDGDANKKMQCFAVKVNDINDNTPVIGGDFYTANVTEVAISYSSKDLAVSPAIEIYDPDQSDLSYGLLENNIPFKLVPLDYDPKGTVICKPVKDFKIIVTDPSAIDYETTTSYSLTMMAWEGCGSSGDRTRNDTAALTINVMDADDEFPFFNSAGYTATVLENDVNKPLEVTPTILASDGDKGLNERMVFGLVNSNQSRPDCLNNLQMDSDTGDISIVGKFSYDSDEGPCRLIVVASQADNLNRKTQCPLIITVIDGNDKCPEFEKQSYEGNFIAGDPIVTEINSGNALTVKILDRDSIFVGDIAISSPSYLKITDVSTSGSTKELKLTVADGVTIDRDATITLSVSDDSLENCLNTVTVSVHYIDDTDRSLSPRFTETKYTATIPENLPVGTSITQVSVENPGNTQYSILSASLQGYLFIAINNSSGEVYVAANINYEALGSHPVFELQIQAKDTTWTDPRFGYTNVQVTVQDEDEYPPTLQGLPVSLNIPENSPINTDVYSVVVTDMDGTASGDYVFTLSDNANFNINGRGLLSVGKELDAETLPTTWPVSVSVEERHDSAKKTTGDLIINIIDMNDNPPVIAENFALSIFENDDTPLKFQLMVNDKDVTSPNNDIVKYEILSAPFGTFIDELTRTVTISELVERKEKSVINLLIMAKDGGHPQLEGLANITIDVIDVNEPPVFVDDCNEVNVDENTVTTICIIQADDYDDTYNEVRYSLENNFNGIFSVDSVNGNLSINFPGLNRETDAEFTLTVHAADNGVPPLGNTKNVHVNVNDVNDNNPIFNNASYVYDVNEDFKDRCNAEIGYIGAPVATDADISSTFKTMRYFIEDENKLFTVVPETGEIRRTSCIDAELSDSSYTFTLTAYNNLSPSSENGTTLVTVNIHDINDEPPIIEVTNENRNIEKDFVSPGEHLLNATWSDSDVNEQNRAVSVYCSFHPKFVFGLLECLITDNTVIIKVKEGAERATDFSAVVTMVAQNEEAPSFITYEEIHLTVTSSKVPISFEDQVVYIVEGDNEGTFYNPLVSENNCLLFEVETQDEMFSITPGKSFSKLASTAILDYETNNTFHLHATAYKGVDVDGICKPTGANDSAVLTVFILDENDEPPYFEALDTNDTFFVGVLFDKLEENVNIFSLSDRASDQDKSARLEFTLAPTFSELSPLLCQRDGIVFMNPSFKVTSENMKIFNFDVEVIDTNTDQNNNSSRCSLQFGILGWNNIIMFKADNVKTVDHTLNKRQATISKRGDLIETCLEKGKAGWWDSSGQILTKIDRIINERHSVYMWLYGIRKQDNNFIEKEELGKLVPPLEGVLKQECGFEEVQETDKRTFVTHPPYHYAILGISVLLLFGIVCMTVCLIYSWNQYLKEKSIHAERLKNMQKDLVVERESNDVDSRSLPESEQVPRDANNEKSSRMNEQRVTNQSMKDKMKDKMKGEEGIDVDKQTILTNEVDVTRSFAKSRRSSGHYTKMGASALLCTSRNDSSKRSSPVVFLTKSQSIRSCFSGKEVLLNSEESTTDIQGGKNTLEEVYQYPRGFGSQNPPLKEDDSMKYIGVSLENPAYQASDEADEVGTINDDEIYDTIDEYDQTQF